MNLFRDLNNSNYKSTKSLHYLNQAILYENPKVSSLYSLISLAIRRAIDRPLDFAEDELPRKISLSEY